MAVENYVLGRLNPVVYFINSRGDISLPPTTEDALRIRDLMAKRGFEFREAGTLGEIDELQRNLQKQEYAKRQAELEHEEITFADVRRQTRDRLVTRMVSSSTRPYEREFIKCYLMLREDKRADYRERFMVDQCYFTIREYDSTHHLHDLVDSMPEMKDDACKRCGRYRRVRGSDLCLGCLGADNG